ncbi:MAG: MotA/TolQ/ExbB proton channel family protein [Thalassotalea sp.]|nr:MotA/TolQ/ExbB proton channel family protein [Thalassotalea sp.]
MVETLLTQIVESGICWIILLVALVCYQQLFSLLMSPVALGENGKDITPTLITVMPLLGLLGTIMGLLNSFVALQTGATGTDLFSQGISEALLTTQLGLLCAIPAWTIHGMLVSRHNRQGLVNGE